MSKLSSGAALAVVFAATGSGWGGAAFAQDAAADRGRDVIVVTARKREENIQDVPLSIAALTSEEIKDAGVTSVDDIALLTPGFTFAPLFGGDGSIPVVRGLSQSIGEPNVGFFVDGVYQQSRAAMEALLGNSVERVEITRGPQSALYGRNTFAGAINFVTRQPSDTFEGEVEATVGSHDLFDARGAVSGPIGDTLAYRIGATYYSRGGYYTNDLTGGDLDDRETTAIAGSLEWRPNSAFRAVLRHGYEDTDNGDDPIGFLENNADPLDLTGIPLPPANQIFEGEMPGFTSFAVTPGGFARENNMTSLAVNWDVGNFRLTSVTGYNVLDVTRRTDSDREAREIHYTTQTIDDEELSQEFRIQSLGDGPVQWTAGYYHYHLISESGTQARYVGDAGILAGLLVGSSLARFTQSTDTRTKETTVSDEFFASVDVDLTDRLTLSVSGRAAQETKRVFTVDRLVEAGVTGSFSDEADFENVQPRVSLSYDLGDNAMVYGSYAVSEKTGGFNVVTGTGAILASERTYDPESAKHYELGFKSYWPGADLTLNGALFHIRWEDQIVRALGATFATLNVNAGQTTSQGFELETVYSPLDGLDLSGGVAYTDSAYDDYTFGTLAALGLNPVLDGTRLQWVSKWTANGSAQYTQPMNGWDWVSRLDVAYQSDQSTVQPAFAWVGDRTVVNLRTGFETDRFEVSLWGENIFGDDTAVTGVFIPNPADGFDFTAGLAGFPAGSPIVGAKAFGAAVTSATPATWGVTARARF